MNLKRWMSVLYHDAKFFLCARRSLYIFVILLMTLITCLTHFGIEIGESPSYYETVKHFLGMPSQHEVYGLRKPLLPLLAILPYTLGLNLRDSMALISTLSSLLTAFVMYRLSEKLLDNDWLAFCSTLFLVSNYIFIFFCAQAYDTALSYLFLVSGMYIAWLHYPYGKYHLTGVLIALGVLAKESTFAVLLYLFLYELFYGHRWRRFLSTLAISIVPLILWFAYSQRLSQYFYGMMFQEGLFIPQLFVKRLIWTFLPVVVFLPFGFLSENEQNKMHFYYLSFVSIFSGIMMLGGWRDYDIHDYFLLFPSIFPLCSLGMRAFFKQLCEKPLFNRLKSKHFEFLTVIATILLGYYFNILTYGPIYGIFRLLF